MSYDRAIEAATEALSEYPDSDVPLFEMEATPREVARIAVEAAAPHLTNSALVLYHREGERHALERAERAEADAELVCRHHEATLADYNEERALADELAEALRLIRQGAGTRWCYDADIALAKWEEARRG